MTSYYLSILVFLLAPNSTKIQSSFNLKKSLPFTCREIMLNDTIQIVGDFFSGGIVFYVDKTGNHGLVCSLSNIIDSKSLELYNRHDPTKLKGREDSATLVNQVFAIDNPDSAEILCNNYTNLNFGAGVFSDWYLPNSDELEKLFRVKDIINKVLEKFDKNRVDLLDKIYWSSSKTNDERLGSNWLYDFNEGNLMTTYKLPGRTFIRAIRSF
jgi:serine/threonine-protein kinase